ncbi:MAG TPA: methyl-accepting chemotaxis protein [Rhodocyclaceae bacterium]|nr:methyl-accepting chemotaxis protein [Rhodocyclaceae bacterium]
MSSIAWKLRGAMAALAVIVAVGVVMARAALGEGAAGWLAVVLVTLAALALIGVLLERAIARPLIDLRRMLEQTYSDGDLTRRADVSGHDEIAAVATALNQLIASFQTIIGKVFFNSVEIGKAADQVVQDANRVAAGSGQQHSAAQATTDAMAELTGSMNEVSLRAHETAQISQDASELSESGVRIASRASAEMNLIAESVTTSAQVVRALGERSQAISGIVQTIREIADQTNLLALNAAIEAARAGEQGRGFAVVADEVRKLAERTAVATGEISEMIGAIQNETQSAITAIEAGTGQAKVGAELARQAAESLDKIYGGARDTMVKVDAIAAAIEQQSANGHRIAEHVRSIMDMAQGNSESAEQTLREAGQLGYLSANIQEIGNVFKLGSAGEQAAATHAKMPDIVKRAATQVGELLSRAVDQGRIRLEDLFDDKYQPFGTTRPPKFKTRFDDFFDQTLTSLQEGLVDQHRWLVYGICCDQRGYVPTHNKRFSQPITGDEKVDFINNRTKRIFDDPVGRRCGSHEQPFLLQTYRRDTGEIMHDISAPIYVKGKHWGGFRIGYRTEM